jgi:hypothetical protein
VSVLLALALAAASARVESVALTTLGSQLAVRVVVSGTPGVIAVHREGDAARISIADTQLGLRFAGGRRFGWTPQGVEKDVFARTVRPERVEIVATPSEVSLLVQLPPDASIDLRRDAPGLLILFRPAPVAMPPPPVATTPLAAAVSAAAPAPLPAPVVERLHSRRQRRHLYRRSSLPRRRRPCRLSPSRPPSRALRPRRRRAFRRRRP